MKLVFSKIGELLAIALFIVVIIVFLPLILIFVLFIFVPKMYEWIWRKLRHDPNASMLFSGLNEEGLRKAEDKDAFIKEYEAFIANVCGLSGAKVTKTYQEGFEKFSEPNNNETNEWFPLSISHNLKSKYSEAIVKYDFYLARHENGEPYIEPYDEHNLRIHATLVKPHADEPMTLPLLEDAEATWMLVAILRGEYKCTKIKSQLWAYVKEYDVWIVKYKHGELGQRKKYIGGEARQYFFDKKPNN